MAESTFRISIPTDQEFLGRECHNSDCARYFRVHADSIKEVLHCPYCGQRSAVEEFYTKDQIAYTRESAAEHAKEHARADGRNGTVVPGPGGAEPRQTAIAAHRRRQAVASLLRRSQMPRSNAQNCYGRPFLP
jgi:hypothetical protein